MRDRCAGPPTTVRRCRDTGRTDLRPRRRFTRVPWVLVASTVVSLTTTTRAGVREVRVLGSLLAYRLEQATGTPADPALVKKLAVELYLAPKRKPDVARLDLPLAQLARKWLFPGVFGRDTRRAAEKALDAAERLDLDRVLETGVPPADRRRQSQRWRQASGRPDSRSKPSRWPPTSVAVTSAGSTASSTFWTDNPPVCATRRGVSSRSAYGG